MLQVRELPALRLHVIATDPTGKRQRWGQDERRAENNFRALSFSSTMPGGFEGMDCVLPRKPRIGYQDLGRLSTLTVGSSSGRIVWEGRLEKTPRQSGNDRNINPQAVGWQAHLEDDKEAVEVYVDRDLTHFEPASNPRKIAALATVTSVDDPQVNPDDNTGIPALALASSPSLNASALVEGWYDAGPTGRIASVYYDMVSVNTAATHTGNVKMADDDIGGGEVASSDLLTGVNSSASGTYTPTAAHRYVYLTHTMPGEHGADGDTHMESFRRVTLWGNHGLTKQGDVGSDGLHASDVIANAVGRWAPLLRYSTGTNGTIQSSTFPIPQLEFREPTTVAEVITQANRFSLNDWSVFEGDGIGRPTFYYGARGTAAPNPKRWRARVGPAQLQETGPQVDRLWNGVIVTYQDVDGTSKSVGPTDAPVDTEDASLLDTDSANPVNQLGMKRYATLDMGIVSTSDAAKQVGVQFLERAKELDQSGSAQIVGHLTDDHGVTRPAFDIRAGDQISFVDASDTSYRRIVKASYDHDSRTCSLDLDAPPEGLDDLLERLSVSLFTGTPPPANAPAFSFGWNPFG